MDPSFGISRCELQRLWDTRLDDAQRAGLLRLTGPVARILAYNVLTLYEGVT